MRTYKDIRTFEDFELEIRIKPCTTINIDDDLNTCDLACRLIEVIVKGKNLLSEPEIISTIVLNFEDEDYSLRRSAFQPESNSLADIRAFQLIQESGLVQLKNR